MSTVGLSLAVIGYGAMARSLIASLSRRPDAPQVGAVLLPADVPGETPRELRRFFTVDELINARPALVVECASHEAVRASVPSVLRAGIDAVVVSIGALGDAATFRSLERAAAEGASRLTVASGAIGGLDVLRAARLAGLDEVVYSGRKPPAAWRDTPAETLLDLDRLAEAALFFEGTAAEASKLYPKNANVTAAVALAGVGFDRTKVRLYADPHAAGNTHELEATGAFGTFAIRLANKPLPENPKTSWLAALSIEQTVLRYFQPIEC